MPAKRVVASPCVLAEAVAERPRERRRLGLNYGGAGAEPNEEGRPS